MALKILIGVHLYQAVGLAQLVERGANKGKVVCSMLKEWKSERVTILWMKATP